MTRVRLLYLAAAALTAAALVLPLWGITMSAPQYPDESLHLSITRVGITGDVHEIETLQHYVGVRFPTELPELAWATRGILALTAVLAIGALLGGAAGTWYRRACAAAFVLFLIGSAAVVQFRLYEVGHERDPHAPLRSIHNFTPPLVGPVRVGNFTVWSFPHAGGVTLVLSAALAVAGASRRRA
jgi:hypothetical protein